MATMRTLAHLRYLEPEQGLPADYGHSFFLLARDLFGRHGPPNKLDSLLRSRFFIIFLKWIFYKLEYSFLE
jgi:hypothetical protein